MATFPPRREVFEQVVSRILPQVDHLYIILNEYTQVPGFLRSQPKITAEIPDENLKDAGKFHFPPDADDIVFLVDDDIAYPADYVGVTLDRVRPVGFSGSCFAYFGNALIPREDRTRFRWRTYMFDKALTRMRGASVIGTGTTCILGADLPSLDYMRNWIGMCDLGLCNHLLERKVLPWLLPRPDGWLRDILPPDLADATLYRTVHAVGSPQQKHTLIKLANGWPHADYPYRVYHKSGLGFAIGSNEEKQI